MEEVSERDCDGLGNDCPECGAVPEAWETDFSRCRICGARKYELGEPQNGSPDDATTAASVEDELSGLKIRQISSLRRGADRARSYCIIGIGALVAGAVQLSVMAIHALRVSGRHLLGAAYAFSAALALSFAWKLMGRVQHLTRELRRPLLEDPLEPPDFSTLSDGSQHVKNLEQM